MSTPAWKEKLEAIRARHAAASRGPWRWFGYLRSREVGLHGPHMTSVLEFRRWGMQGAQPVFCTGGILQDVSETATPDTNPRRGRVTDINHPDARFIAASWQDVRDLLARVDALEAERDELMAYIDEANAACGEARVTGEPLAQTIQGLLNALRESERSAAQGGES